MKLKNIEPATINFIAVFADSLAGRQSPAMSEM
jgi:hypothetical protein